MILFSHPTGNNNAREAATAIYDAGLLFELHICVAACGGNIFDWLASLPGMATIRRRSYASRLRGVIRTHPWREACRLIVKQVGFTSLSTHESGFCCVDSVYQNFDRAVSRRISNIGGATIGKVGCGNSSRLAGVYCYEDGALATFRAAKASGMSCLYDLPIAYWRTARGLLAQEAERWPAWEPTLVGTRDSAAKCDRKDEELELADAIFCPSAFVKNSLTDEVLHHKSIHVIPFGSPLSPPSNSVDNCDSSAFESTYSKVVVRKRPLKVMFAGSMTQRKGLADLFAAMRLLTESANVELHVMGSPVLPIEFYRTQYSSFTYHHTRSNDQVLELMQTMDVFCLPSIVEGRALVMQEAMSQGLPLIITPNTGGEDLIDVTNSFESTLGSGTVYGRGQTGFLVPIRSAELIAASIDWCSTHREELSSMRQAAITKSREYTWSSYGVRIVNAIKDSIRTNP